MSDIVEHLRSWGLKVVTKDGYANRGRPYSFTPKGVLCHHTASSANSGNFGSEGIVTFGRSDLPGPLCQFLLGRDGTVMVIALGYANHAGYGGPHAGIPANMGNTYLYGIEAENNGIGEKWQKDQLNAYYRLCAALLAYMNTTDVNKVFGHKEWAPTRKIDPTGINMDQFRVEVGKALKAGPSVKPIHLERVVPGKRNKEIIRLKRRLAKKGFFEGKVNNNAYDDNLKKAVKKYQKSLGYKGDDADGVVGKSSLESLGFFVQ